MLKEQDILQWLFQMIVEHVEKTGEDERLIRRLEVTDDGLDLHTKDGLHFQIIVQNPSAASAQRRDIGSAFARLSGEGIHLPCSDWETLIEACESMLQYLRSLPGRAKQY